MKEKLFQEFEEVSARQWKQKIQVDLKGEDYNDKLIYKSLDGIHVKPFYHKDDVSKAVPTPSPKNWDICERIYVASVEISNKNAKNALQKGAESLWFVIPDEKTEISELFKDLESNFPIFISLEFLSAEYVEKLRHFFRGKSSKIVIQTDIIGNLARTGNWFYNLKQDHVILDDIVKNSRDFKSVISVDSALYQNAGATIPQQLAYALAHANEYLNRYAENGNFRHSEDLQVQFIVASGSNYFFEIAKIKAFRWLFATLAREYNIADNCHILALPSKRNKTLYDYNVNMLRTTTESMSAVLGGADTVYNLPYDAIFHKNNEFGDRIARNQLLVMKNEAYLDKVSNAAEGAYYIESITRQFAEMALDIFKEIEKNGGFLRQLKEGIIQRKIKESVEAEQKMFDDGKLVLIGTNTFENPEDKMLDDLELYPFLKKNPRKTLIQPILERRLSEKMEQEKLEQEKAEK
jgi:methylmalonyl-CoA mutase